MSTSRTRRKYTTEQEVEVLRRVHRDQPSLPVLLLALQSRSEVKLAELDLVASTVSNHLAKVKPKLDARTIAEIVACAHHLGLV